MEHNIVGWFEIPATDLERAKAFYEKVFEIELPITQMGPNRMAWFPWHKDTHGITGALVQGEAYTPSTNGSIVYMTSYNIEESLARVEANGGKTIYGKTSIGEHGWVAHFQDTEGNRVALHSRNG